MFAVELSAGEGAIAVLLTAVLAVFTWIAAKFTNAANLEKKIGTLTDQVFKLTKDNHLCELRCADQKVEIHRLLARVMHLEKWSGIGVGEPLVGVVIADTAGVIKEFSPTLTPLFRWRPGEVIGKSVFMLMPLDVRDIARKHLALYTPNPHELDSKKLILTEGLTKTGTRFPIVLSLRGWPGGDLVTATIRERDMVVPTPGGSDASLREGLPPTGGLE